MHKVMETYGEVEVWLNHSRMWEKSNAYRILVGKPKVKGPLTRPRCSWERNIKMDL
jgi:hypothetical protein